MDALAESTWQAIQAGLEHKAALAKLLRDNGWGIDLRVDSIQYQIVHLHNLCVSFILIRDNLLHYEWWDKYFPGIPGPDEKMANASRYNEMVLYGSFIGSFSNLESYVRNIVFALDGERTIKRNEHFYKQRKHLYENLVHIKHEGLNDFFRLMQILRNCIHNHGVYFDPKYPEIEISYSGINYTFKNQTPPNCVQPEFVIDRISDTMQIIYKTSSSKQVLGIEKVDDRYDLLGSHETANVA